ncbi:LysR family transcriptional regulator [Streptomyces bathyalis]|uniref:LysR family transcriptional regulator n=1 Tax=Streptomyces bathyalis TaxID=2710756 RepID=A0A7T1TAF9_9ACTN|nr:LysR substrate-binding domain-containing protein [Streptomyces bathyalis]QPP09377.1 LysR family transcriptional regulator [Streptomyces bathyalis]
MSEALSDAVAAAARSDRPKTSLRKTGGTAPGDAKGAEAASGATTAQPNALPYVSFNQLRSFHAVAVAGSITAAASLLHVSQPTVTVQLRQLESHYGVELVRRTPRNVRLTELGESLFTITQQLFALEGEAVELLNSAGSTLRGRLRVGGVAPYFVMRLLSTFSRAHPGVALSLQLDNSATVIRRLIDQEIDVGIVGQTTLDSRLHALPYSRQDVVLFCRDDHPWAGRDGVRLHELADMALVLREKGSTCRLTLEQVLQERGIVPRVTLEVCREGVREAVVAGFGVGITTDIEYVPERRTRMLRILDADIYTEAFAVCLRERRTVSVTRAFMATAEEFFDRARE